MLKFIVVLYRRPELTAVQFREYLAAVHGPLAEKLPGLRKYVHNYVADDATRRHPGWDAVIELYWDDRASMESAWLSPEGDTATADLAAFTDLQRTSRSMVDEAVRR